MTAVDDAPLSLSTSAARNLATTTKTVPQMQEISSRWLLRMLPWVDVRGGTYRVNRRLCHLVGDGRLVFTADGARVQVVPEGLAALPVLRGYDDLEVLRALADRCVQRNVPAGALMAEYGMPADEVHLLAHGRAERLLPGEFGGQALLGMIADGEFFGAHALLAPVTWPETVRAATACTTLTLSRADFHQVLDGSPSLRARLAVHTRRPPPQNKHGEAAIALAAGHTGEPRLPATFVDYEPAPREYELSLVQTVLRVHTRVADLYSDEMDQLEQQVRLTVEAVRERQEYEMVNNPEFGLLHNADLRQRLHTRTGPPTPDDMDNLLSRRRKTRFFLAHPRAIAAFFHECNKRGLYPTPIEFNGHEIPAWRGVPIFPCGKIPISERMTTSILAMRVGEEDQGVVGLHRTGIPDEYSPSLSVRFMGITQQAVIEHLVTAYFSCAVLVPDALGVLDSVELGRA